MTTYEKKRKAAMIAVAYYIEQEKVNVTSTVNLKRLSSWSRTGQAITMGKRHVIQLRGKVLHTA